MSTEAVPVGEAALLQLARDKFRSQFGREPVAAAAAPGRVNLIGEHIDYCQGFVLPVALPFLTVVVGGLNSQSACRALSVLSGGQELHASFPAPAHAPLHPGEPAWANYVKGVVANFPGKVPGFDLVVVSDVPVGAGLSSSAAIEVAVFTFLEELTGITVDPVEKAKLCQRAEHEFPGMPCGIMDQYVVTMARPKHALLIDCRSLESTHIPMELGDAVVLVINSNVKHQLTGSEYPQRRTQCQRAAQLLGLSSLREASLNQLEDLKKQDCEKEVIMRAQHVIEEIARTEETARVLPTGDWDWVGELLYASHESLSRLMEVSCAELDALVGALRGAGRAGGVYGARMTGGGFGGCVIALVHKDHVEDLKKRILSEYKGTPTFFISQPSGGARPLKL